MLVFWDEKACLSGSSKWVTGRQSSINKSICALQCLLPFPGAESGKRSLAAQRGPGALSWPFPEHRAAGSGHLPGSEMPSRTDSWRCWKGEAVRTKWVIPSPCSAGWWEGAAVFPSILVRFISSVPYGRICLHLFNSDSPKGTPAGEEQRCRHHLSPGSWPGCDKHFYTSPVATLLKALRVIYKTMFCHHTL